MMLMYMDLVTRLSQPNVIIGIAFAMIGVGIALLAKRITFYVRKTKEIDSHDVVYRSCVYIGIGFILIGLLISILY